MTLQDAIEIYKQHYQEEGGLAEELYKWEILTKLQGRPNLNAENFYDEIYELKFGNLVYGPQTTAIRNLAKYQPERYREAFRALFDETVDLQMRITAFIEACDSLWDGIKDNFDKATSSMVDERLIAAFLACKYPEKYTFYKNDIYSFVCQLTDQPKKKAGYKLAHYYALLNTRISPIVAQDAELNKSIEQELDAKHLIHSTPLVPQTVMWYAKCNPSPLAEDKPMSENVVSDKLSSYEGVQYWWLVATPKVYTFAGKPVGERQTWTLRNDNGHKRKVFKDFEAARVGDVVICYDANPTKQIVGLAVVTKASDGEEIEFQKTESLMYPIDWTEIKANNELAEMKFVKSPMAMTFCSLTDDEADALMSMIREKNVEIAPSALPYTKADFLNEVFMDETDYKRLVALLLSKKNIVLQGAPGVGKTFTAKRLAYSILGAEDPTKVEIVQFHQNYSYEDFIMGYKPTEEGGFDLRNGVFYSFCKRAAMDKGNKYFFIIDEINRGNLSKIFGELLMLIENDYREKEIKLAYRQEEFAVPNNVYIIGMMNTADRSLAMIDYALRRRFSFFDIKPGFHSEGFKKMQADIGSEKFEKVIDAIKSLNSSIEEDSSLGSGFCIGHSYFCIHDDEMYSDAWLENIVDYDIDPMLREYWFDNRQKYESEIAKIRAALK